MEIRPFSESINEHIYIPSPVTSPVISPVYIQRQFAEIKGQDTLALDSQDIQDIIKTTGATEKQIVYVLKKFNASKNLDWVPPKGILSKVAEELWYLGSAATHEKELRDRNEYNKNRSNNEIIPDEGPGGLQGI